MMAGSTEVSAQGPVPEMQGQARDALDEKAKQAAGRARQVQSSMQSRAREEVTARCVQAGHQVESISAAFRKAADHLRGQGNQLPAQAADRVADKADDLGTYLRASDADRILDDIEGFGRSRPWVGAAAGVAVGIAAARFLKASGQRRHRIGTGGSHRFDGGSATAPGGTFTVDAPKVTGEA